MYERALAVAVRAHENRQWAHVCGHVTEWAPVCDCPLRALHIRVILMRQRPVGRLIREVDSADVARVHENALAKERFEHGEQPRIVRQRVELGHFLDAVENRPLVRVRRDRVARRRRDRGAEIALLLGVDPPQLAQGRAHAPPQGQDLFAVDKVAEQQVALLREALLQQAPRPGRRQQVARAPQLAQPGKGPACASGRSRQAPSGRGVGPGRPAGGLSLPAAPAHPHSAARRPRCEHGRAPLLSLFSPVHELGHVPEKKTRPQNKEWT